MAEALAVWMYGIKAALLTRERRLRLVYTEDAFQQYRLGNPLLSLALPLIRTRFTHLPVSAFIEGLLPEGEPRRVIARELGVRREDTFGLIGALGRECAGAIVFQPDDELPPPPATTLTAAPLSDGVMTELVANLREAPLGVEGPVRISLAGVQEKLVLTRLPDGRWGRPINGTPSTHLLKPEILRFPNTVENEAFCMRLAKHLGMPVANVETTEGGGRKLLVVERYDRIVHADGRVDRIHQEDICQAEQIPPDQKYEDEGGPSLRRIAQILQTHAPQSDIEALIRATVLNVLIGNGDAHGKNFSLLHEPSGTVRLAPLYDLISTRVYGDQRLAMRIDNVSRIEDVTMGRLMNEVGRWGLSDQRAKEVITDLLSRVPSALGAASAETPGVPADILELVQAKLASLHAEAPSGE